MDLKVDAIKNDQEKAMRSLLRIEEMISNTKDIDLEGFDGEETAIIFVDMVHGFVDEGLLQSERALTITGHIKQLDEKTIGFHKVFFVDRHEADSSEFNSYGQHCVVGTSESELIDDYDTEGERSIIIYKNSVNGFVAPAFRSWVEANKEIRNFIIVGLVTDICVLNFALTLKAYHNQINFNSRLMVPTNCVETFDFDGTAHHAGLMNAFALYNMQMNGIELVNFK